MNVDNQNNNSPLLVIHNKLKTYFNVLANVRYSYYKAIPFRIRVLNGILNLLFMYFVMILSLITIPLKRTDTEMSSMVNHMWIGVFLYGFLNLIHYYIYRQTFVQRMLGIRMINVKTLKTIDISKFVIRYGAWYILTLLVMPILIYFVTKYIHLSDVINKFDKILLHYIFTNDNNRHMLINRNNVICIVLMSFYLILFSAVMINPYHICLLVNWVISLIQFENRTLIDRLFKTVLIYDEE